MSNDGTVAGPGTIANYGIINSGAHPSGPNVLDPQELINSGVVVVLPGASTQIGGTVTQSTGNYTHFGSFDIYANATLTSKASMLDHQTFVFDEANANCRSRISTISSAIWTLRRRASWGNTARKRPRHARHRAVHETSILHQPAGCV